MSSGQLAGRVCAQHAPSASRASHFEQPVFGLQRRPRRPAAHLQRAAVRLPARAARATAECRWLAGAPQSLLPSLALASASPPQHQRRRPAPKHAAGVSSEKAFDPMKHSQRISGRCKRYLLALTSGGRALRTFERKVLFFLRKNNDRRSAAAGVPYRRG